MASSGALRVGLGYDIHRLVPGRPLILGGVRFESEVGLLGHSDADVVCHAIADALLGASGLGDIGVHFPPSDNKWKDANSLDILRRVVVMVAGQGGRVQNVDVTVVAERPKIAPQAAQMRTGLAETLGVEPGRVSIKATTHEEVGPEGRGEAISATAVCLIAFDRA